MRRDMLTVLAVVVLAAAPAAPAVAAVTPTPAFLSGTLPGLPPMAAGGGEVLLDVGVDTSGAVQEITTLRTTPGYTEPMRTAVAGWKFTPASVSAPDGEAHVLVIGVFRPPTVRAPGAGAVPEDVAQPTSAVPYPEALSVPALPPKLWTGSVVLVRLDVDPSGAVTDARVLDSSTGGAGEAGSAAVSAVRGWRFRAAQAGGEAVASTAYAVIGFAEPVIAAPTE